MTIVPIHINGREYQLACDAGQEELLVALGQEVDDRVRQLSRQVPQAGEAVLLLLTALMLADEVSDERRTNNGLKGEIRRLQDQAVPEPGAYEAEIADALQQAAGRIEAIAQQLEMR